MITTIIYKLLLIPSYIFQHFSKKRLRVLAYHDVVDSNIFNEQISYLNSNYNIIDITTLSDHLFNNKALPKKPLLITFDDGDISVLENGLPVLQNYKVPASIFIITELINSDMEYWFSLVRRMEKEKGKSVSEVSQIMKKLKDLPNVERVARIKKFGKQKRKQLTTEDLKIFKRNNIFIANHSHTHPMFNKCTKEELQEEFKLTRSKFEEFKIESGYEYFAYPNGNWDESSEEVLKKMRIKVAFLFDHKINKRKIDPYRISRIRTNSDMSIDELKIKVSGFHSVLQKIKYS